MIVRKLPPEAILEAWDWLSVVLAKPLAMDGNFDLETVFDRLRSGDLSALIFDGAVEGIAIYAVADGKDGPVFFLPYVAGRIDGGPKRRLAIMQAVERAFCTEARRLGCSEIRGGGRNWHRLLPGWEQTSDGLRKVL